MTKIDQLLESIPEYANLDSANKLRIRSACFKQSKIKDSNLKKILPSLVLKILLFAFWCIFILRYACYVVPKSVYAILPFAIFLPPLLIIFSSKKAYNTNLSEEDLRKIIAKEMEDNS